MHEAIDSAAPVPMRLASVDTLLAKRERLGTALHELATDLARERRRNAVLEREIRRLREQLAETTAGA